jgi:hypothetical protein
MEYKYFREFSVDGKPGAGYVADGMPYSEEDIRTMFPDAIEISEAGQMLYVSGEYIRDAATGRPVPKPAYVPTLDEEAAMKLAELDQDAANTNIAGFYSAASGTLLFYDSDVETQKQLDGIIQRTTQADWTTKVRYPGVAPSGKAPVRGKPQATSPDSLKEVQLLDADQLKTLVDDLDSHLFSVKARIWQKQAEVKVAYDAGDIPGIKAVNWNEA